MARPCKSIETSTGKIGKDKIEERKQAEQQLRGDSNNIKPPSYLSSKQKKLFKSIVEEHKSTGILSNLDIFILATVAIAIDRLEEIETMVNKDITKLMDKALMSAKDKYTKDLMKCLTELSMTPASRAKIGAINAQSNKDSTDPLLTVLKGGGNQ